MEGGEGVGSAEGKGGEGGWRGRAGGEWSGGTTRTRMENATNKTTFGLALEGFHAGSMPAQPPSSSASLPPSPGDSVFLAPFACVPAAQTSMNGRLAVYAWTMGE